jgi:hypothetical protein
MLKNIIFVLSLMLVVGSACAPETPKFKAPENAKNNLQGQFLHHVYFWMKDSSSKEDVAKLIEGLETLTKIESIRDYHIGLPAGTDREVVDNSYGVSWLLVFDDAVSQDEYQTDSIHLAFVKNYSHLWEKVQVYDSKTAQ